MSLQNEATLGFYAAAPENRIWELEIQKSQKYFSADAKLFFCKGCRVTCVHVTVTGACLAETIIRRLIPKFWFAFSSVATVATLGSRLFFGAQCAATVATIATLARLATLATTVRATPKKTKTCLPQNKFCQTPAEQVLPDTRENLFCGGENQTQFFRKTCFCPPKSGLEHHKNMFCRYFLRLGKHVLQKNLSRKTCFCAAKYRKIKIFMGFERRAFQKA